MTTKQRAYLKGLAMTMDPIFQVGKASMNPGLTEAIAEALEARELIKISVLKNCMDDPREIAETLAERTQSQVVQVIGKKIVLYKEGKDDKKKIQLPFYRTDQSNKSTVPPASAMLQCVLPRHMSSRKQ